MCIKVHDVQALASTATTAHGADRERGGRNLGRNQEALTVIQGIKDKQWRLSPDGKREGRGVERS